MRKPVQSEEYRVRSEEQGRPGRQIRCGTVGDPGPAPRLHVPTPTTSNHQYGGPMTPTPPRSEVRRGAGGRFAYPPRQPRPTVSTRTHDPNAVGATRKGSPSRPPYPPGSTSEPPKGNQPPVRLLFNFTPAGRDGRGLYPQFSLHAISNTAMAL